MADTTVNVENITASAEMVEEINFIETNAEEIANRLIAYFEEYTGEKLFPGDHRREFLQGFALPLVNAEIHINETGRGNLLRYATGAELDELGRLYQTARLDGDFATVEMQINISQAQAVDVVIAAGTRVTPDGTHFFALDENVTFEANVVELSKTVTATAIETGEEYNGFLVGQINKLVESNEYVSSVKNTTASSGGENPEDDESYRERLRVSPFSFSVAGPANAYRSIAMSVSSDIGDIYVHSPTGGVVEIVVVKTGGEIPETGNQLLSDILTACSADDVRPLTDNVQVVPATAVEMNINVQYYVPNNDVSVMMGVMNAVNDYIDWQTAKIGRDINPDYLNKLMIEAGAARVVITEPTYQALEKNEIAQVGTQTVTFAGSINM